MADNQANDPDSRNREIAQEAQTDTELESVVPPRSRFGPWFPIGLAVVAVLIIIALFIT